MKQMYLLACALLLSVPSLAGETRVEVVTKTTKSWDGAQLPAYPGGQPEVTILRITIPAGVKLPMHKHPVINAGLLLTGELTVTTKSGDVIRLGAGDSIVEL
ncbi:MAG: cupin domain-containing protein, partial [Arenicellales bacterium]